MGNPGDKDPYRTPHRELLARDKAGVLWLYKGTGRASAPYAARTRTGGGWSQYNQIF
ncbi:hypothetical protein [Streptomyces beijiangensis]|uniref:Uncharacterized protein n=1 Tax=Streptomyces beijiangensis TaxID=163361 RepID=A0A939JN13_9ACTN|nr:hypothetical protein [Streptomyces beijiangensis]MBO0517354.1 hypothetical protein [Streptomyces beijiangensis]